MGLHWLTILRASVDKNKQTMINVHRSNIVNGSSIIMFMYISFNFKTQNNAMHNSNQRKTPVKNQYRKVHCVTLGSIFTELS